MQQPDFDTYARLFPQAPTVFDSVDFARLNASRMAAVTCFTAHGMGTIIGRRTANGPWCAPFSAPYATVCGEGDVEVFVDELIAFTRPYGLRVTLPAPVYGFDGLCQAYQSRAKHVVTDLNFHYPLERLNSCWEYMTTMARRNLRLALRNPFSMAADADPATVYRFIANHHRRLGYHMAMTEDAVLQTARVLPVDFFTFHLDDVTVGAAIIYQVAPGIVQLINWGDDLDRRQFRTSSYIAHALFTHYRERGLRVFDLGPATVDGIPNQGLINFKRSLGAIQQPKLTLSL